MADAPTTVPTARSLKQWNASKELDGRMTVKFTLTDPAEARAWAAWLSIARWKTTRLRGRRLSRASGP